MWSETKHIVNYRLLTHFDTGEDVWVNCGEIESVMWKKEWSAITMKTGNIIPVKERPNKVIGLE